MLFAELSGAETVWLILGGMFIIMAYKVHIWKEKTKAAVSNTWQAVKTSPVTEGAARVGIWYFLHRLFR